MKKFFNKLKRDRIIYRGHIVSFFILLVSAIYLLIYYQNLPPFIPLFNQLPWGEERLMSTIGIFLPVFITTIIAMLNVILSSLIYEKNPLVPRILTLTSLLLAILTLLFIIRTIQIVL